MKASASAVSAETQLSKGLKLRSDCAAAPHLEGGPHFLRSCLKRSCSTLISDALLWCCGMPGNLCSSGHIYIYLFIHVCGCRCGLLLCPCRHIGV